MKKVLVASFLVLGFCFFASASFAAKAPIKSSPMSNDMRVGIIAQAAPGGFGTIATGGMRFNQNMSGDLGFAYGTNAAGTTSNIGLLLRLEYELATIGDVKTKFGGNLMLATNPTYAAAATSSITLNGFVGVEYSLLSNLSLLADLSVLEINSTGGVTTFGIGSGTAFGSGLGAGAFTIITGARLYI